MNIFCVKWYDGTQEDDTNEGHEHHCVVYLPTRKLAFDAAQKLFDNRESRDVRVDKISIPDPSNRDMACRLLNHSRYVNFTFIANGMRRTSPRRSHSMRKYRIAWEVLGTAARQGHGEPIYTNLGKALDAVRRSNRISTSSNRISMSHGMPGSTPKEMFRTTHWVEMQGEDGGWFRINQGKEES